MSNLNIRDRARVHALVFNDGDSFLLHVRLEALSHGSMAIRNSAKEVVHAGEVCK